MTAEPGGPPVVEIRRGLPERYRRDAAELFFEGFREKLGPILRSDEKAVSAFAADENPEYSIAAIQSGSLVGICSVSYGEGEFFDLTLSTFVREFGLLRGTVKLAVLAVLFRERPKRGELLIDGIVVSCASRGLGIGSRLLDAAFALAMEKGRTKVTLEVVDTNDDARRLYERLGFTPVRTERTPYLKRFMGFSAVTKMEKLLR